MANTATKLKTTTAHFSAPPPVTDEVGRKPIRMLSKMEICDRANLTFPTIWEMIRDGKFPAGREVRGRTLWLESEFEDWCNNLPVRKYKA
jgi:predicted DNA-binding transcriptional regulator AlpA